MIIQLKVIIFILSYIVFQLQGYPLELVDPNEITKNEIINHKGVKSGFIEMSQKHLNLKKALNDDVIRWKKSSLRNKVDDSKNRKNEALDTVDDSIRGIKYGCACAFRKDDDDDRNTMQTNVFNDNYKPAVDDDSRNGTNKEQIKTTNNNEHSTIIVNKQQSNFEQPKNVNCYENLVYINCPNSRDFVPPPSNANSYYFINPIHTMDKPSSNIPGQNLFYPQYNDNNNDENTNTSDKSSKNINSTISNSYDKPQLYEKPTVNMEKLPFNSNSYQSNFPNKYEFNNYYPNDEPIINNNFDNVPNNYYMNNPQSYQLYDPPNYYTHNENSKFDKYPYSHKSFDDNKSYNNNYDYESTKNNQQNSIDSNSNDKQLNEITTEKNDADQLNTEKCSTQNPNKYNQPNSYQTHFPTNYYGQAENYKSNFNNYYPNQQYYYQNSMNNNVQFDNFPKNYYDSTNQQFSHHLNYNQNGNSKLDCNTHPNKKYFQFEQFSHNAPDDMRNSNNNNNNYNYDNNEYQKITENNTNSNGNNNSTISNSNDNDNNPKSYEITTEINNNYQIPIADKNNDDDQSNTERYYSQSYYQQSFDNANNHFYNSYQTNYPNNYDHIQNYKSNFNDPNNDDNFPNNYYSINQQSNYYPNGNYQIDQNKYNNFNNFPTIDEKMKINTNQNQPSANYVDNWNANKFQLFYPANNYNDKQPPAAASHNNNNNNNNKFKNYHHQIENNHYKNNFDNKKKLDKNSNNNYAETIKIDYYKSCISNFNCLSCYDMSPCSCYNNPWMPYFYTDCNYQNKNWNYQIEMILSVPNCVIS